MQKLLKISKFFILLVPVIFLSSCGKGGFFDPDWSKTAEPNAKKRARANVEDGRGIKLFRKDTSNGPFLFASSNPLWRASLEAIDFMILSNVDYAGGVIITDWYSDESQNESIKITIKFLTNEVRSDALIIDIKKRTCDSNNRCSITKIENDLNFKIKRKILKQAAIYQKDLDTNKKKRNTPKKNPVARE